MLTAGLAIVLAISGAFALYLLSPRQSWCGVHGVAGGLWGMALPALVLSLALFMHFLGTVVAFLVWFMVLLLVWVTAGCFGNWCVKRRSLRLSSLGEGG